MIDTTWASCHSSHDRRIADAVAALDGAAVALVEAVLARESDLDAAHALPAEHHLRLVSGRTSTVAAEVVDVAFGLVRLPGCWARFSSGRLTQGHAVEVVRAATRMGVEQLLAFDEVVVTAVDEGRAGPELSRVIEHARWETIPGALQEAADQRERDRRLVVLPRLDGSGRITADLPAEPFATTLAALDAAADRPARSGDAVGPSGRSAEAHLTTPHHRDQPARPAQLADALARMAASYLAGEAVPADGDGGDQSASHKPGRRARPRVLAIADLDKLAAGGSQACGSLLSSQYAGPAALPSALVRQLLCDADVVPVMVRAGTVTHVGEATATVSDRQRTAVIVRDRCCTFPGCSAPPAHCDIHHLRHRRDDGPNRLANLTLLCRRHHTLLHRRELSIERRDDGALTWSVDGRQLIRWPLPGAPSPAAA